MELFKLEPTKRTPEIILNPAGAISFSGRSITENAVEFFKPIKHWVEGYLQNPQPETVVNIKLEYFNSSSARMILDILQELLNVGKKGGRLVINWFYEEGDDDILERGEYYASILDTNFNFIEYE
ncbi:MAG TPA: DUF1987 domain-containing protein [Bacteroidetes bacterium]|nr:DUF1987 domain-containing protein [Bacteroidota bacterium]